MQVRCFGEVPSARLERATHGLGNRRPGESTRFRVLSLSLTAVLVVGASGAVMATLTILADARTTELDAAGTRVAADGTSLGGDGNVTLRVDERDRIAGSTAPHARLLATSLLIHQSIPITILPASLLQVGLPGGRILHAPVARLGGIAGFQPRGIDIADLQLGELEGFDGIAALVRGARTDQHAGAGIGPQPVTIAHAVAGREDDDLGVEEVGQGVKHFNVKAKASKTIIP